MARRKPQKSSGSGFSILTFILVAMAVAVLCGLGVWQVYRLHWKTQLLTRIEALKYAPAEPLNVALNHLANGRDVDFIRVQTPCEPAPPGPVAHIYTVTDDGPGWRPVVLCRLKMGPYPGVPLDLGVEPESARGSEPMLSAPASITGVLRTTTRRRPFMAMQPQGAGEFGWRDAKGVAAYLGAPDAAPVFLMLETPAAAPTIKPAPAPSDIPNNHLGYALTWFGLAAALIAVYASALIRRRRKTA